MDRLYEHFWITYEILCGKFVERHALVGVYSDSDCAYIRSRHFDMTHVVTR
jgi:hypothetical protein